MSDPNSNEIVIIDADEPTALVVRGLTPEDHERVADDVAGAHSPATRAAYAKHWRRYVGWCEGRDLAPLPSDPLAVAVFLGERADAGLSISTLTLDLVAISQAHLRAGADSPREDKGLRLAWKGIKRRVGAERGRAPNRKAPLLAADVASMVTTEPSTLAGIRNRALLALGFAGAFRRSELVVLELRDVEVVPGRGLRVTVRKSKADQAGEGFTKPIAFGAGDACPVRAVRAWLDVLEGASVADGPVFRSVTRWGAVGDRPLAARRVAKVIKAAAVRVGLDPARVSGHSLRAGYVTTQLEEGTAAETIIRTTGHHSTAMIPTYDRRRDVWTPSGL